MRDVQQPVLRLDEPPSSPGPKTAMATTVVQQAPSDSSRPSAPRKSTSSRSSKDSRSSEFAQRLPTAEELAACKDIPVYDKDGNSLPFKSFFERGVERQRHLVIFVRHFFCGMCQDYLRHLVNDITPSYLASLPTPTKLSIVGCGSPDLIPTYQTHTNCPFPIYTDPSRKLYDSFGLSSSMSLGQKRPEYQTSSLSSIVGKSLVQGLSAGTGAMKGGNFSQLGAEMLFQRGEVLWCHRMSNTRDHTEVADLKQILARE